MIEPSNNYDNPQSVMFERFLSECKNDNKLIVLSVNVGNKAKHRLANLGLIPGAIIIKKKTAPFKGPIEIMVLGSSLVIGRGLAENIVVKS